MFEPRLALASLSGTADATWARAGAPWAGCAFLGGISLDKPTRAAARRLCERDREEFLPENPVAFVDEQFSALAETPLRPAINVRTTSVGPLSKTAAVAASHDAILEVNAHCRQAEMCETGAGERLLRDGDRLCEYVRAAANVGATVSVKLRTEVAGVDLPALAPRLERAGADLLHVDAMDSEAVIGEIRAATDAFLVANNGVRDRATVREYLRYGADAISVGRPSDDPRVLERVSEALSDLHEVDA
ncbi:tRNA-dihydrouridine synthase [Halosegnis sp.]|uniref:tRNA-dihydrouridine synthase n=1 Tax=Halosegnis sp. TaxID=2864959 RepID=UPI0035D4DB76